MYSSNPFPDLASSPNNEFFPPNFLIDQEKKCSSFNYHQNINIDPFFSGDCFHESYNNLAPPSPAIDNNIIPTDKQDFGRQLSFEYPGLGTCEEDHDDLLESIISSCKKKKNEASKTHGHSKIHTAQGPRDRRVRMSIDISRKFFCLQDLLGFDKASKTLDWLFSKCKSAIKELVEVTNHNSSSTAASQSKTCFLEAIIDGGESKKKSKLKDVDGKRKKLIIKKPKGRFQIHNLGREQSRAVARARARERVREKMRIKQLNDELKNTFVHDYVDYQNFKSSGGESNRVISAYPRAW